MSGSGSASTSRSGGCGDGVTIPSTLYATFASTGQTIAIKNTSGPPTLWYGAVPPLPTTTYQVGVTLDLNELTCRVGIGGVASYAGPGGDAAWGGLIPTSWSPFLVSATGAIMPGIDGMSGLSNPDTVTITESPP